MGLWIFVTLPPMCPNTPELSDRPHPAEPSRKETAKCTGCGRLNRRTRFTGKMDVPQLKPVLLAD